MKKYDINNMLEVWSTGSNISNNDPFPATDATPEDVEDLAGGDSGPSGSASDMITHTMGPTDPKNIPGPDKKPIKEAEGTPDKLVPPKPKKPPQARQMMTPDMKFDPSMMGGPGSASPTGDPSMSGMDPSLMGMGMTPGPTDSQEVGRVYELKKIYSRLVSMQSYLSGSTDVNLIKLRNYVSNTMDLFRTLISNIALYKDKIDEIIITFYKVVDNVYVILSKYYKDKDTGKMIKAVE